MEFRYGEAASGGTRRERLGAHRASGACVGARTRRERVLHRQRQLDARRARSHRGHTQPPRTRAHAVGEPLPARDQPADWFRGDGVIRRARRVEPRRDADIYRQHVVGDRRPVAAQDRAPLQVEPHRLGVEQPRPREPGERTEVDVDIVESVEARNQARQHPRVGGVQVARDDGDPHAGEGAHPQPAEHDDVAVAPADEDEVLQHGNVGCHRPTPVAAGGNETHSAVRCRRQRGLAGSFSNRSSEAHPAVGRGCRRRFHRPSIRARSLCPRRVKVKTPAPEPSRVPAVRSRCAAVPERRPPRSAPGRAEG